MFMIKGIKLQGLPDPKIPMQSIEVFNQSTFTVLILQIKLLSNHFNLTIKLPKLSIFTALN